MVNIGTIGAIAIFTTAKVHISLLAFVLYLFCLSKFSMVFKAKTVELLPAPKRLDIKLITIRDKVSGFFCLGKSSFVKGGGNELKLMEPLAVYDGKGNYTQELLKAYED